MTIGIFSCVRGKREFRFAKIRSLFAWQASLPISERRNRTRACFAHRVDYDEPSKNPDRRRTIGIFW